MQGFTRSPAFGLPRPALLRWAVAGALAGAFLALAAFMPAAWLAQAVEQACAGRVVLADPRGTAWSGSAQLILAGGSGSRDATLLPGRVQWQLRPGPGGLSARLSADCCTTQPLNMHLAPRWTGWRLQWDDGRLQWPAALLAGLGAPWNTVQFEGQFTLATDQLVVERVAGRLTIAGQARLDAMQLSSRLSTLRPLGDYQLTLRGGDIATLQLTTLQGSLKLEGSGQWVGSRLRFSGEASAAPDREAALSNLLNIIGRRNGARSIITMG